MNPLLNTRSLSVEEQSYILFSLLNLLSFLVSRRFPQLRLFNLFAVFLLGFVSFVSMMLNNGLVAGLTAQSGSIFAVQFPECGNSLWVAHWLLGLTDSFASLDFLLMHS